MKKIIVAVVSSLLSLAYIISQVPFEGQKQIQPYSASIIFVFAIWLALAFCLWVYLLLFHKLATYAPSEPNGYPQDDRVVQVGMMIVFSLILCIPILELFPSQFSTLGDVQIITGISMILLSIGIPTSYYHLIDKKQLITKGVCKC